jgi:hypothetical protein
MATYAHPMVRLSQSTFRRVQIRLEAKASLVFVARGTLDALGTFIQLRLVNNILSIFEPMMALSTLYTRIVKVKLVRKFNRWPAATGEYRLVIQDNIFRLSVEIDRQQETSNNQNQHENQKMSPSHAPSPWFTLRLRPLLGP